MKVLAVDPGEKRIGLAISDPTGTIARPLCVIKHTAREIDAYKIVEIAHHEGVEMIIVGQPLDANGEVGFQARKSHRLAEALRTKTDCDVQMWDESGTTQAAIQSRVALDVPRKKRKIHLDEIAASILLQDFLIANEGQIKSGEGLDEQA
jgi:putative Holliday junction resolvase